MLVCDSKKGSRIGTNGWLSVPGALVLPISKSSQAFTELGELVRVARPWCTGPPRLSAASLLVAHQCNSCLFAFRKSRLTVWLHRCLRSTRNLLPVGQYLFAFIQMIKNTPNPGASERGSSASPSINSQSGAAVHLHELVRVAGKQPGGRIFGLVVPK